MTAALKFTVLFSGTTAEPGLTMNLGAASLRSITPIKKQLCYDLQTRLVTYNVFTYLSHKYEKYFEIDGNSQGSDGGS